MFMFCDHNMTDLHRLKEDRFTILFAPVFIIFFGIPWSWKAIKLAWAALIWCCSINEYVEEEDDDFDIKKKN